MSSSRTDSINERIEDSGTLPEIIVQNQRRPSSKQYGKDMTANESELNYSMTAKSKLAKSVKPPTQNKTSSRTDDYSEVDFDLTKTHYEKSMKAG